jgi:mRNA-degrading endonuclease RelE of RelBE toxin-antitoxin system
VAEYAIDFKPSARKELERLSDRLIARLMSKIEGLAAARARPAAGDCAATSG